MFLIGGGGGRLGACVSRVLKDNFAAPGAWLL